MIYAPLYEIFIRLQDGSTLELQLTMDMSTPAPMSMSSTFSFSTEVTLFFTGWTTNTPAKYIGTLVFVFSITILNRFLGAVRSQLGHKWADHAARARREQLQSQRADEIEKQSGRRRHRKSASLASALTDDTERQPLTPLTDSHCDTTSTDVKDGEEWQKRMADATLAPKWTRWFGNRWRASNPWRLNIDLPRAVLEGIRSLVGYLL